MKFDLAVLLKYISTVVSEVRKHGKDKYVFFWHNVDNIAWEHYINPKYIDARRPGFRDYDRDVWVKVESKSLKGANLVRKQIQVLLACSFFNIKLPSARKLANVGKTTWIKFFQKWLKEISN